MDSAPVSQPPGLSLPREQRRRDSHDGSAIAQIGFFVSSGAGDIDKMNTPVGCAGGSPYTAPLTGTFDRDSNFLESIISPNQFQADGNFRRPRTSLRLNYNLSQKDHLFSELN